jgi:hypothetical protein
MSEITLVIGGTARWNDNGSAGRVQSLMVDPNARTVTHLVVEPHGRSGLARLVPIGAVTGATGTELTLSVTEAEFENLKPAEQTLVETSPAYQEPFVLLPGTAGWLGSEDFPPLDGGTLPQDQLLQTVDIVDEELPGEQEENRGDRAHATDGDIGRLRAISVEAGTGAIADVILKWRPLGGEIFVPIGDVTSFENGIHIGLSKADVEDLLRD